MPTLEALLADIGSPTPRALSRAFGVPEAEAARWLACGGAPRPVMAALFLVSRWGQSQVNGHAVESARLLLGLSEARAQEIERLEAQIAALLAAGDFGAANAPLFYAGRSAPAAATAFGAFPLAFDPGAHARKLPDHKGRDQRAPDHDDGLPAQLGRLRDDCRHGNGAPVGAR